MTRDIEEGSQKPDDFLSELEETKREKEESVGIEETN